MYNWSTNLTELKKHPKKYKIWRLEQLINYGLNGEKINSKNLKKYFHQLNIDPEKKAALKFLLYSND